MRVFVSRFYDRIMKLEQDMLNEYNELFPVGRGITGLSGATKIDCLINRLESTIALMKAIQNKLEPKENK